MLVFLAPFAHCRGLKLKIYQTCLFEFGWLEFAFFPLAVLCRCPQITEKDCSSFWSIKNKMDTMRF